MALWANYLPNAKFLFFDITNQIKPKAEKYFDLNRMKFEIGDAYTKISQEIAQKHFSEGIDFLVDDGPHTLDSMVSCIKIYSPLMKSGGVIVIEDVQSYDWFNVLERESPKNCIFEAVDVRRDPVVYDDMVAVLKF
jgi:cephalosporin hydroxylase